MLGYIVDASFWTASCKCIEQMNGEGSLHARALEPAHAENKPTLLGLEGFHEVPSHGHVIVVSIGKLDRRAAVTSRPPAVKDEMQKDLLSLSFEGRSILHLSRKLMHDTFALQDIVRTFLQHVWLRDWDRQYRILCGILTHGHCG